MLAAAEERQEEQEETLTTIPLRVELAAETVGETRAARTGKVLRAMVPPRAAPKVIDS